MLVLSSLICLFCAPREAATIEVRVRAESSLNVDINAAGTDVRVAGSLRDELDRGLAQRRIRVVYEGRSEEVEAERIEEVVHTDRHGRFRSTRELDPGRWRVAAYFEETEHITESDQSRTLEVEPEPVDLRVQVPELVFDSRAAVPVRVRASVSGVGLESIAAFEVDGSVVGEVELDQFGRGSFDLAKHLRRGPNEVTVAILAGQHRERAELTEQIRLAGDIDASAVFEEVAERLRRGVAVEGRVADESGPIEGARVSIHLRRQGGRAEEGEDDRALETLRESAPYQSFETTDADGEFRAFFAADRLQDGRWSADTKIVPEVGPEIPISTEPLDIERGRWNWVLNALGVLAVLGVLALVVQRLWQVIGAWFAKRRRKQKVEARTQRAFSETEQLTPRRLEDRPPVEDVPDRESISGIVWDVWKDEPLDGARLVVSTPDGAIAVEETSGKMGGGQSGAFIIEGLEAGRYQLEVKAAGFVPGRLDIRMPHRGRLSNARFDLVAVPLKIRRLYQSLVELLEGEDVWGRLSPREIEQSVFEVAEEANREDESGRRTFLRALRRRLEDAPDQLSGGELARVMTDVVEQTYFSGRLFDQSAWRFALEVARRMREQFGAGKEE